MTFSEFLSFVCFIFCFTSSFARPAKLCIIPFDICFMNGTRYSVPEISCICTWCRRWDGMPFSKRFFSFTPPSTFQRLISMDMIWSRISEEISFPFFFFIIINSQFSQFNLCPHTIKYTQQNAIIKKVGISNRFFFMFGLELLLSSTKW